MGKSWEKALPTKRGSNKQIFERQSRQEDVGWSGRGANLRSGMDFLIDGRRSLIWELRLRDKKAQFQYITVHKFSAP